MNVITKTPAQTRRFAQKVAEAVLSSRHRTHAAVVALSGDLGAGKTTFAQGFARALGIGTRVASPTFVIFRSYKLLTTNYKLFYHVDAYRLHNPKELAALGFKKILADPKNIVLIEWPENISKLLPRDTIMIRMEHGGKASERIIAVCGNK